MGKKTEITTLLEKINERERLISTFESNLDSVKNTWNNDYNNFMKQYNNFNLSFDEKLLNQFKEETKNLKTELYSKISEKYVGKSFYEIYENGESHSITLYVFNGFHLGQYGDIYLTGTTVRSLSGGKGGVSVSVNYDDHMDVSTIECLEKNYKLITVDVNKTISDLVCKIDNINADMKYFTYSLMGKSEEGVLSIEDSEIKF